MVFFAKNRLGRPGAWWRICVLAVVMQVVVGLGLGAAEPSPRQLAKQARAAEKRGDAGLAYALWTRAATQDRRYWARSEAAKRAAMAVGAGAGAVGAVATSTRSGDAVATAEMGPPLTFDERREVRELMPAAELLNEETRKSFNLTDNAKYLYEQVGLAFGYLVILDQDLPVNFRATLRLENVTLKETLRVLELATDTIVVPLDAKAFLVAADSQQKRQEREPVIAITVPIPDTVTAQEAVEVGTALRAVFNLQRIHVDPNTRQVFMRDAISKVRPAMLQLYQLMAPKSEVQLEIEIMDTTATRNTSFGLDLPNQFTIQNIGGYWRYAQTLAGGIGGNFALAIGSAQLFARASTGETRILFQSRIRASNLTAASLKVGQSYPIITTLYTNYLNGEPLPPQIQFVDLGFVLKVTPRIHDDQEVTLDVEAEFKTLGGESFNGVPVINTKKIASQVRLRAGEWAAIGGLMSVTEGRTVAGFAGLTGIPVVNFLTGSDTRDRSAADVLVVIRPRVVISPPLQLSTRPIYIGSEQKPLIPL